MRKIRKPPCGHGPTFSFRVVHGLVATLADKWRKMGSFRRKDCFGGTIRVSEPVGIGRDARPLGPGGAASLS
jgi:hypothetical protein